MRALFERLNWALTVWLLDLCEGFDRWTSERRSRAARAWAKLHSLTGSRL